MKNPGHFEEEEESCVYCTEYIVNVKCVFFMTFRSSVSQGHDHHKYLLAGLSGGGAMSISLNFL